MAEDTNMSTESMEDQVRRMVIGGGGAQPPPVVRLAPNAQYPPPHGVQHSSFSSGAQSVSHTTCSASYLPRHRSQTSRPVHHPQRANQQHANHPHIGYQQHPDQFRWQQHPNHFQSPQRVSQYQTQHQPREQYIEAPRYQNGHPHHQRPFSQQNNGFVQQPRGQQQLIDPNAFGGRGHYNPNAPRRPYDSPVAPDLPNRRPLPTNQSAAIFLDTLVNMTVPTAEALQADQDKNDDLYNEIRGILYELHRNSQGGIPDVSLEIFGSSRSGFSTLGSDMDLVMVPRDQGSDTANTTAQKACSSFHEDCLPRLLERKLLERGLGARLLIGARVPILKVCRSPSKKLLEKLRRERKRWDHLPEEEKYPSSDDPKPPSSQSDGVAASPTVQDLTDSTEVRKTNITTRAADNEAFDQLTKDFGEQSEKDVEHQPAKDAEAPRKYTRTRERKAGPLDFPAGQVGAQADINFSNALGVENTKLLRCYSLCDPRVRPMVMFIKEWAKIRQINSSYSLTLSSYGYVLMVLHFLMNVAYPPVIPNLQAADPPVPGCTRRNSIPKVVNGWNVDFWSDEDEIQHLVQTRQLASTNTASVGSLLYGFFHYFAAEAWGGPRFHWKDHAISTRTHGGILLKEVKGWTMKSEDRSVDGRRVQNRYLLCIEDPFEHDHNVARTVNHPGCQAIRAEFKRAAEFLGRGRYVDAPAGGEFLAPPTQEEMERDGRDRRGERGGGNKGLPARVLKETVLDMSADFPPLGGK